MKLYLKQQFFSWGDKFTVYDEAGNEVFYVEGDAFTFGKKLHIYSMAGEELRYIRQKLWSFRPRYIISHHAQDIAWVTKEFSFLRQIYTVAGYNWRIEGDFLSHEYRISSATQTVAWVSKKWFTLGDAFEINIASSVSELDVLAVVLVVDACLAASDNIVAPNT